MAGAVTELIGLDLDDALEPTLIHAGMVLLGEPARCAFECEVVGL